LILIKAIPGKALTILARIKIVGGERHDGKA